MSKSQRLILLLPLCAILIFAILPLNVVKAENETLFKVTIIAPGNANMVRRQWGQIFANSLKLLGIDARVVFLGWTSCYDRCLTPPYNMVGKTWDQGGYDIQLIGWTPGLFPEPRQLYYGGDPAFFAPDGQNYYLWNNSESNLLLDTFITATDPAVQNASLQAWQSIFFNEMPSSQIMYQSAPAIVNPVIQNLGTTANGEGWLYFNVQCNPEYLKGKSSVVYCSTGEIESLIPPLSNSWYDTIINSVIFNGLAQVATDLSNLTVPALLVSWSSSDNGFKWTYNLRHGVKWHDGYNFTADDVLFSLWALMNPNTGSQFVGYYQSVYGNRIKFTWENGTSEYLGTGTREGNITAIDPYTVELWLPQLALGKPYGYIDPYLIGFANNMIPKHIFEKIPAAQWTDSPFNTGQGSINIPGVGTYTGPIGTGPYKWISFDPVTQLVHLQKFTDYWNKTALEADGMFGVQDYYIKFIADKTSALAALKNGEVDMLDTNYQMQVDVPSIDPSWGKVLLQEGTGRQEIGYNMRHPIFGTGVDTPLGKANPSRAAEAAKYVRLAFDYAIPRQLIIDNLLAGFGEPATTPMLPTQPYYNASITARPYDLAMAKHYLELAGYTVPGAPVTPTVPSFILGDSYPISGIYTDADGNPIANRELALTVTTNNATYNESETVDYTTTNLNGWYRFDIVPTEPGVFYYYLFDREAAAGSEWTYVAMLNVSSREAAFTPLYNQIDTLTDQINSLQSSVNNLMYAAVAAIVIAIAIGAVAIFMAWKKH